MKYFFVISVMFIFNVVALAQKPRARDLGIPFTGETGKFNAIRNLVQFMLIGIV